MEKELLYSVQKGKVTLHFWRLGAEYRYTVNGRKQMHSLEAGLRRGRISQQDYINITQHGGLFL